MKKKLLTLFLSLLSITLWAQFPGAVGTESTSAINKDSIVFKAWAVNCRVERGLQNIANPALGLAKTGHDSLALGIADGIGVVSLGDGGNAILTFKYPITNGEGYDFAVFENAFNDYFLELAFVEVSSNGKDFFRFPAISNIPTEKQTGTFENSDPTLIHHLAGKYRANYGTPFDLEELKDIEGLDINYITHVKIIDVIGSIQAEYASYDYNGNVINDPYPTPFESGGFDLDAVGVIHEKKVVTSIKNNDNLHQIFYPNPLKTHQKLKSTLLTIENIKVYNPSGSIVFEGKLYDFETKNFTSGIYFIQIQSAEGFALQKLIIQS